MRPDVDQLLRRAGSRVRGAAFARGFARGATYLALAVSAGYVAARIAEQPAWTAAAWWWAWVAAAAAGMVSGCVACARARFDRAAAAGVLEQRLQTGGLLLAAADGAELSDGWRARLAAQLGDAGAALPRVRWSSLAPRLTAALALLAAVQLIPAAAPPQARPPPPDRLPSLPRPVSVSADAQAAPEWSAREEDACSWEVAAAVPASPPAVR